MKPISKVLSPFWWCLLGLCLPGSPARAQDYAENFSIERFPTHRLITVRNVHRDSTARHRYALVPKGDPAPKLPEDVRLIRTPVERLVAMETVYIGHLEALDLLDRLAGAATAEYISNPEVRARVESGEIRRVQIGQNLDIERMLTLRPDLILTSISGDPSFDVPPQLTRSGLPVVLSAGYMERHPLARAEWIKFTAAFFEADDEARRIFDGIADRYEALGARTAGLEERPSVFCAAPYSGAWHMPGGLSYTAQTIRDAGGRYLWADTETRGSMPLDTERVFLKAAEADFWINPSHHRTLDELLAADPRFAKFEAVKQGRVYNNTRQVTPNGGNPIWEAGIVRPDLVLADLIHIFHPEILPEHELVFYEPVD
ncbi:MAG: ABC transporter substrate-binding protein [Opitutales bacterium]